MIKEYGPFSATNPWTGGSLNRRLIIGSRNANDFPEPVGAFASISLIYYPIGIACIWIAVGLLNPKFLIFLNICSGMSFYKSFQLLIGLDAYVPYPLTIISLFSLNILQSLSSIS